MLQTQNVRKGEVVAVSWKPDEIYVRFAGKEFFGKEELLCRIEDGHTLFVDRKVAEKYGIAVVDNF